MIKREWRQLLEMIKFSLGKGKAPELRVETDWGKFYRICKFHKIQSMVCPGIQKLPKAQQHPELQNFCIVLHGCSSNIYHAPLS